MKKLLTYILTVIALFQINARAAHAQELVSEASAALKQKGSDSGFDYRAANLKRYLAAHNSPLSEYANEFVKYADAYGIDYRMVPAISGVESTFGKRIPKNSYNAYGWANGEYRFASWEDSIEHVSMTLRTKYIDKGAATIAKISKRYAPPSNTWGKNVRFFMRKIDSLPLEFSPEG